MARNQNDHEDHAAATKCIQGVIKNLPDFNFAAIKKACVTSMKYAVKMDQKNEKKKSST
jgi:hypothetical protein